MRTLLRLVIILAGFAIGPGIVALLFQLLIAVGGINMYNVLLPWVILVINILSALVCGGIFLFFSKRIADGISSMAQSLEQRVLKAPPRAVAAGGIGLLLGLLIAMLISIPIERMPTWISVPLSLIIYIICGFLGARIAMRIGPKIHPPKGSSESDAVKAANAAKTARPVSEACPKILDTSVIIDGRIFDICKTGILEGSVVIPEFVLSELRHIADSADSLKRTKGRRGLDILNKIQRELSIPVHITSTDYEDVPEVDAKLLRLAKETGGIVITNDFNLNKVAAVQGVRVFNINELANAVKPVMLPGEELSVTIVKEGKENAQGVAYLDDGTMIVVENARNRIGETLNVVVTSALQTSAGRMIFARGK